MRVPEAGRLLKVTEASGTVTEYSYDKAGNKLTQKDANSHVWTFRYDALNRLIGSRAVKGSGPKRAVKCA